MYVIVSISWTRTSLDLFVRGVSFEFVWARNISDIPICICDWDWAVSVLYYNAMMWWYFYVYRDIANSEDIRDRQCVILTNAVLCRVRSNYFPLPLPEATIARENEWLLPTPTRYAIFKFVFLGLERLCVRAHAAPYNWRVYSQSVRKFVFFFSRRRKYIIHVKKLWRAI